MKGRFLALEGIDGSGKTTQLNHLLQWIPNSGLMPSASRLLQTREPGGTPLGCALRQLLLHPSSETTPEAVTELLLYAADRAQHVTQMIRPALERGDWVITERFSGSMVAYQGHGRGLNQDLIRYLEHVSTFSLDPDVTLWLDLAPAESKQRCNEERDRIESEGLTFLSRVADGFNCICRERGWIRIDAASTEDIVSSEIETVLRSVLSI